MKPLHFLLSSQQSHMDFNQGPTTGVITHVKLNYHELVCIELALIGLKEHIRCLNCDSSDEYDRNNHLPKALSNFSASHLAAQLRYIKHWLDQPAYRAQLQLNAANSVLWPIASSEIVDWLLRIGKSCISLDAILIKTYESASSEYADFAILASDQIENEFSTAINPIQYSNFSGWQHYYQNIVNTCQFKLVRKFASIKSQGYPLFPKFSQAN